MGSNEKSAIGEDSKKNLQLYRIGKTKGFEMKTMARKTI